ncbi:hypothetical protein F0562_027438 [Nyssa sinensis]|uniref:Uncharacterized protein n=1 Tax=Nyssa sinensis TaxID=561372 RepID=A0A5J5B7X2_9ASTE|nr:hypothetical protein F0562_027438 [Nyssa sinensis]
MLREEFVKASNSKDQFMLPALKDKIEKLKFNEVMDRSDVKEKIEALKAGIENSGLFRVGDLDQRLKEKIVQVKEEVELKFADVLKSLDLHMEPPSFSDVKDKVEEFNEGKV